MRSNVRVLVGVWLGVALSAVLRIARADDGGREGKMAVCIAAPGNPPVVVAPTAMEDQVQCAVADLTNYLGKITGLSVRVAQANTPGPFPIYVGDIPANQSLKAVVTGEKLGDQGYVLDVAEDGVHILGGSKYGTAYGVYEFLERLGVRWLFPGEWGDVVPRTDRIALPAGRFVDKPGFAIRSLEMSSTADSVAWKRRQRCMMNAGFGGHSDLISNVKYGKVHPEWYAEVDGKRQNTAKEYKLCHSNPAMVQQAVAEVLDQVRARARGSDRANNFIVSISPTDGAGFCRCAECLKMGSLSDRLQVFANTIAGAVRKEFPDYYVGYYGAYSEANTIPTVKAHPNVAVFMTTWDANHFVPMTSAENRSFRELLEAFGRQCPYMVLRDYDYVPKWHGFLPLILADVHAADYPWYIEHGVRGVISEGRINSWGPCGYSYYLTSKLMWNPKADLKVLKEDFIRSAYGEAAEIMRRYYRRIDEAGHTYPEATIYALRQDRQEAARTARDPGVRARIDDLRACYLLVELYEKAASHSITRDEYVTGIRMARSINWYISPIMESSLTAWGEPPAKPPKLPDAPSDGNPDEPVELDEPTDKRIQPMTSDELHRFLDALPIPEPAPGLPAWNHADDGRLLPLGGKGAGFPVGKHVDMGAGFRFGTYTLLIHAKANERRRQA